jgi:hypothetical protein
MYQMDCANTQGMVVNACPTQNLVGCCKSGNGPGVIYETCNYPPATTASTQQGCSATHGIFSTGM